MLHQNDNRAGGNSNNSAQKTMKTQVISHNADNQLFATRQQALAEISRNEYTIYKEATTMPCSFDERQRNRFDLNCDDEMAINVFVIDNPDNILEPILIGYVYDELTLSDKIKPTVTIYLIDTYEAYMASEKGITASVKEPKDTIYYKHEILDEQEVELPDGYTFDGKDFCIGNRIVELTTYQQDNGDYVTCLISSQGIKVLRNWGKY